MRIMLRRLAVIGALAAIALAFATPANARVWVGFGFPLFYPAPMYYPPPAYYPPPPAYYPPPPGYYPPPGYAPPPTAYAPAPSASAAGQQCIINGSPLCPMERPSTVGSTCWCTTANGRAYGQAR